MKFVKKSNIIIESEDDDKVGNQDRNSIFGSFAVLRFRGDKNLRLSKSLSIPSKC